MVRPVHNPGVPPSRRRRRYGRQRGLKREIVRTLETTDHATAKGRKEQAITAIRKDIEGALAAAGKRPLSDWVADWQSRALLRHEELKGSGDRIASWQENPATGEDEPIYAADDHREYVFEEAPEVEGRHGPTAAAEFSKIAEGGGMTVATALERWLAEERAKMKGGTIASHEAAFKRFGVYLTSHEAMPGSESVLLSDVSHRVAGEVIQARRAIAVAETMMRNFSAYSGL